MNEHLKPLIAGKKILILGFGKEGQSSLQILRQVGGYAELAVADAAELPDLGDIKQYYGADYLNILDDYDIVFKSPGIVLPKNNYKCRVTSQTEQFLNCYSRQCIGITGTKGKSTTASLLYHVLSKSGLNCILAGNIGTPVFGVADQITPSTIVILELSCHQLEFIETSPAIAVLLNIYEDHLDHYSGFEEYVYVKQNIYRYQKASDLLLCDAASCPPQTAGTVMTVTEPPFNELPPLKGAHNLLNAAFAYEIAKLYGISDESFKALTATFKPLPHRLDYIGSLNGADYYDDSISTTVESTINAVSSIENSAVLLIGGLDRGINYSELINFLLNSKLREVVLMYESGARIMIELMLTQDSSVKFTYIEDLQEATNYAKKIVKPGEACILSPAAASYGHFKNFEERGDKFRRFLFD